MTQYVGGLRSRLIHDSLYHYIQNGLTAIGWFNSGRQHLPLNIIPEMKQWDEELPLNTITIAPGDAQDTDWELGSFGRRTTTIYWIDVYGESEVLSNQVAGDIVGILKGQFTTLGYGYPTLPVYDYTQATPSQIFYCEVEKVRKDRAQNFPHRWQRNLNMISVDIVDYVSDDSDPNPFMG